MVTNLLHVLFAQGLLAVGGVDGHAQSDRLIDEIIAGCDKNVARIDQGRFRYKYSVWSDQKQVDAPRKDFDVQFYLKGKKIRRDMGRERLVMDGDDSEFLQLANGAFIVARQTQIRRASDGGLLPHSARREIVLIHCDVESLIPDDLFTLAGLGMPTGSRVQDRVRGNESIYEADP